MAGPHLCLKQFVLVIEVSQAARHTRPDITTSRAQAHHCASCHVLTAVITHAFYNSHGQRVSDGKPLPCTTTVAVSDTHKGDGGGGGGGDGEPLH